MTFGEMESTITSVVGERIIGHGDIVGFRAQLADPWLRRPEAEVVDDLVEVALWVNLADGRAYYNRTWVTPDLMADREAMGWALAGVARTRPDGVD